jgi:hypothetical protein
VRLRQHVYKRGILRRDEEENDIIMRCTGRPSCSRATAAVCMKGGDIEA